MTTFPRFLYLILLAIAVVACKNTPNDGKDFNIEIFPKKKEYHLGDTLVVKITHPKFSEMLLKSIHTKSSMSMHTTRRLIHKD